LFGTGRSGVKDHSDPAVVGVDHLIRHFPEHRKLALLADESAAFNAFTIAPETYALRLP